MGFDVYLRWKGMTPSEESAQYTAHSMVHGHVGYLRWSYEEPNPVLALLKPWMTDAYPEEISGVRSADLVKRLPKAKDAILSHDGISDQVKVEIVESFANFVILYEKKEKDGLDPVIEIR